MYREFVQIKSLKEVELIVSKYTNNDLFTDNELNFVAFKNKAKSLGARYLIKKSILDFLDLKNGFIDIEIANEKQGKPFVTFKGKVRNMLDEMKINNIQVSISHSKNFISTLVVME